MRKEEVVSRNPKVMNGALVFSGTRVPVEILIQHLAAGDSLEGFLAKLPARLAGITQSPILHDPSLLLGKVGVALGEAVDRIPVLTRAAGVDVASFGLPDSV